MKVIINEEEMEVIITRKRSNKNTYLRVKSDKKIYVTTNYFTTDKYILKLINDNKEFIIKSINRIKKQQKYEDKFYYLGNKYDIVYSNIDDIIIGEDKIFINKKMDLNKWLKRESNDIFKEELDKIYKVFPNDIPYPSLTIRNMKTRWGVCNTKTKRVTLNFSLIKRDIKYLDYVIVHELSHLVYPNHSKEFWNLVSILVPDYKKLRKELNSYE